MPSVQSKCEVPLPKHFLEQLVIGVRGQVFPEKLSIWHWGYSIVHNGCKIVANTFTKICWWNFLWQQQITSVTLTLIWLRRIVTFAFVNTSFAEKRFVCGWQWNNTVVCFWLSSTANCLTSTKQFLLFCF